MIYYYCPKLKSSAAKGIYVSDLSNICNTSISQNSLKVDKIIGNHSVLTVTKAINIIKLETKREFVKLFEDRMGLSIRI